MYCKISDSLLITVYILIRPNIFILTVLITDTLGMIFLIQRISNGNLTRIEAEIIESDIGKVFQIKQLFKLKS